jgi:phage gp29-like protein
MAKQPTRKSTVLGPDGKPFQLAALTEEQAPPTSTGVRSVWTDSVAGGLDPGKLAALLKSANEGDNHDFLILAEEMEERDGHYASVLGQRKRAVSGIEPIVTPASDDATDKEIAEAVENLMQAPNFADMVDDLLDGIAKGYSAVETIWETGADRWTPSEYIHRDPRHFQFDKRTGRELRIREDGNEDGLELNPYGWIVHRPKLKSGLTVRGGIARIAAWCFMLKAYTLQDWAAFLEVFGMPLRLGRYDDNASAEEKRILLRAVRDLGSDAAAIIPKGMEIDFVEAKGGQGNAVFGAMTEYLDKQMSKAIIGQTMTTDEGSSRSQSETHDEVRGDIKRADARQMGTTINRALIAPFVGLNWGWEYVPPTVSFPVEDPEDIEALTKSLGTLVPLGLRVSAADVNKRMGFRVPDKGEQVLEPQVTAAPNIVPSPGSERAHRLPHACPSCGETHLAATASDEDPLVSEALEHWEADMGPTVAMILASAKSADSYEAFLADLDQVSPDVEAMADRLATQMMKARGDGDIDG